MCVKFYKLSFLIMFIKNFKCFFCLQCICLILQAFFIIICTKNFSSFFYFQCTMCATFSKPSFLIVSPKINCLFFLLSEIYLWFQHFLKLHCFSRTLNLPLSKILFGTTSLSFYYCYYYYSYEQHCTSHLQLFPADLFCLTGRSEILESTQHNKG